MKFTKVIREFAERTLSDKLYEVDKKARAHYDERKENCLSELKDVRNEYIKRVNEIIVKHSFDTEVRRYGSMMSAGEAFCGYDSSYVVNKAELDKIVEAERARRKQMEEALKNIELECALGADKQMFMEMLEQIKF